MNKQRGELSLIWCAVLMGLLAFAAMAGLFAMRYQRNLFAEAWNGVVGSSAAQALQNTKSAAENTVKADTTSMRKCTIDGKTVYSNVDCNTDNPTSRSVALHDSHGIEAPKAPPVVANNDAQTELKGKMIEAAIAR